MNHNKKLRVLFPDHMGLPRGKYLPPSKVQEQESRFCQGVFAVTYDKELVPAPGSKMLEGLPDLVAHFDISEMRDGWRDDNIVIADLKEIDGTPHGVCGRTALKNAIGRWEKHGLKPKVGIELEAYAFVKDDAGNWVPYDTPMSYVYNTGPTSDPLGFTDAIWDMADEMGFKLEMLTSEFDAPQFEFTLTYDDALQAVDDIFLFKLMAREIALECGVLLSFMPKPIPDIAGSGLHVNLSLINEEGTNVIGDPNDEYGMSKVAKQCVAGLMQHHKGMAALVAPIVNSYERLRPASLSGFWCNWAVDHRGVTTRVASETGPGARIEHRMGDCSSSPYVLVSAVLNAARLGVENEYELPAAETGDCLENHDAEYGIAESLGEALRDLQSDELLVREMGEELVGNLIAIKEVEIDKVAESNAFDYYIHYV